MENPDLKIYALCFIKLTGPRCHIIFMYMVMPIMIYDRRDPIWYILCLILLTSVMSHVVKFCIDISIEDID